MTDLGYNPASPANAKRCTICNSQARKILDGGSCGIDLAAGWAVVWMQACALVGEIGFAFIQPSLVGIVTLDFDAGQYSRRLG